MGRTILRLHFTFQPFAVHAYSYFKKGCHSQLSILEPKGTLGIVMMSDNAQAKFVTVWP